MQIIQDWLEDKVEHLPTSASDQHSDIEQRADHIRAEAEAEGFTAAELSEACGGDIAEYLKNRLGDPVLDVDQKMAGNPISVPPLGFRQE